MTDVMLRLAVALSDRYRLDRELGAGGIGHRVSRVIGAPRIWARDPRFVDTPGWSNRASWDGGIIYSQGPEQTDSRYLRFIPDFITRFKATVNGAAK